MEKQEAKKTAENKDLVTKADPQRNSMVVKTETKNEYVYSNGSMTFRIKKK